MLKLYKKIKDLFSRTTVIQTTNVSGYNKTTVQIQGNVTDVN